MKKILLMLMVVMAGSFFPSVDTTYAACSYNGWMNSNGRCTVSYSTPNAPGWSYNYNYNNSYNYQYQNLLAQIEMLQRLLEQLEVLQEQQQPYQLQPGNARVDVITRSTTDIEDDRARLRGEVNFNREDEATVYFQWGESRTRLNEETTHMVLDEDDDNEDFSQIVTRLNEDETYYYRAVAEDEAGRRDYGGVMSFTTDDDRRDDDSNDDEAPDVATENAEDVDEDSAELYGEVDMNDFDDGIAFFVYGEDEGQIEDIADDYDQYRDIDEDGDDLQKVLVDSNVDGSFDAWARVYGLDDDTDHYFSFCVEYEDEDDDDVIICGNVEDFTTDRD